MTPDLADELLERVAAAPWEDLRELLRVFDQAREAALLRLLEPARILTPDEAAQLVSLPVRRLRSLSRGKVWALRVGGALRIDEAGLLSWARCSQRARIETEGPRTGAGDVHSAHENARAGRVRRLRTIAR